MKPGCPQCEFAKKLFERFGLTEKDITINHPEEDGAGHPVALPPQNP